jgi:hypothetical protein
VRLPKSTVCITLGTMMSEPRWTTRPRRFCAWGGDPRCDQPAVAGTFKSFCPDHAAKLSAITVGPGRPLRPKPAAKLGPPPPPPPPDGRYRPGPRCKVVGCAHKAKPGRPVCGSCKLENLPLEVLAEYKAEQSARPHKKTGRPPKAAAAS